LKLHALFQTIKSSFGVSELWRPQKKAIYREWKEFKERKRIERELETLWQWIVRSATGYSPLSSKIVQSDIAQKRY
jgi:hypothetical protein